MSAARVINPFMLSEMCKMSTPTVVNICGQQHLAQHIKRDLFGPPNRSELHKIFTEEIESRQEVAAKKWGFDFRAGVPLTKGTPFVWERVSIEEPEFMPQMYALTHAAHVRPLSVEPTSMDLLMDERAERENLISNISAGSTDTDSCDESQDETMVEVFKIPAAIGSSKRRREEDSVVGGGCERESAKRQTKITAYMKQRKRLSQTPKKVASSPKRARLSPPCTSTSSSSASSSSSSSNTTQSVSSFFTLRSNLRRKI